MPISSVSLFIVLLLCAAPQAEPASDAAEVHSLSHAGLTAALSRIAERHSDVASLHRYGESREGRALEALRLTAVAEPAEHPALLLVANLEGPRTFESGVVLHHAESLASGYPEDEAIRALLDSTVVWLIPRANPDAAEARYQEPEARALDLEHGSRQRPRRERGRGSALRRERGRPGHLDALRGSGRRVDRGSRRSAGPDRGGPHQGRARTLEGGPGVARPRRRRGAGRGSQGDVRVDRNFASGWEAHTAHGGRFATDEPEARALCEFVMARKNLALVVAYDGLDNLVEEPASVDDDAPAVQRVPKAGVLASDAKLLEELGRRYREETGNEATGSGETEGTFARWCYDHRGLTVLEAVLWNLPSEPPAVADREEDEEDEAPEETGEAEQSEAQEDVEPSADAEHLTWIDAVGEGWRFVDWQAFEHPELGPVEIGGFAPYARLEPPEDEQGEIVARHLAWFLGLGELLPRVAVPECTMREIGPGVWEVEAVVRNDSYLPLMSRSARRTRTIRPARIRLHLSEAAELVSGELQQLERELAGSGGRAEYTWLVGGPEGMEVGVEVDTDHAGTVLEMAEVIR